MKLYAFIDGPPTVIVRMTLKNLNIPHELIIFDYVAGEQQTDEFAKINPQKEIPVLDDNGFILSDSNAIVQLAPMYFDFARTSITRRKARIGLEVLESYLRQGNTKYVAGDQLTIADFAIFASINGLETVYLDFSKYKLVFMWYNTFKINHPELWKICEACMELMRECETNPARLKGLKHPYHPPKNVN